MKTIRRGKKRKFNPKRKGNDGKQCIRGAIFALNAIGKMRDRTKRQPAIPEPSRVDRLTIVGIRV